MPWSQEHRQAHFDSTSVRNDYEIVTGRLAMPVSFYTDGSQGPGQEVVCATRPYGRRVMRYSLLRRNAKPQPPRPDVGRGETFLGGRVLTEKEGTLPDGATKFYLIEGFWIFCRDRPYDEFPVAKGPESARQPGEVVYRAVDFISSLYDPTQSTGGAGSVVGGLGGLISLP